MGGKRSQLAWQKQGLPMNLLAHGHMAYTLETGWMRSIWVSLDHCHTISSGVLPDLWDRYPKPEYGNLVRHRHDGYEWHPSTLGEFLMLR